MPGSLSDVTEVDLLKLLTGQATTIFTSTPYTPWLALFTVTPSDSAAGTEATGGGYARVSTAGLWATPTAGAVANSSAVNVGPFSGSVSAGAAFVAFALFDASTGGNRIIWGPLTDITKTGAAGDTITFAAGALALTAD